MGVKKVDRAVEVTRNVLEVLQDDDYITYRQRDDIDMNYLTARVFRDINDRDMDDDEEIYFCENYC